MSSLSSSTAFIRYLSVVKRRVKVGEVAFLAGISLKPSTFRSHITPNCDALLCITELPMLEQKQGGNRALSTSTQQRQLN